MGRPRMDEVREREIVDAFLRCDTRTAPPGTPLMMVEDSAPDGVGSDAGARVNVRVTVRAIDLAAWLPRKTAQALQALAGADVANVLSAVDPRHSLSAHSHNFC